MLLQLVLGLCDTVAAEVACRTGVSRIANHTYTCRHACIAAEGRSWVSPVCVPCAMSARSAQHTLPTLPPSALGTEQAADCVAQKVQGMMRVLVLEVISHQGIVLPLGGALTCGFVLAGQPGSCEFLPLFLVTCKKLVTVEKLQRGASP